MMKLLTLTYFVSICVLASFAQPGTAQTQCLDGAFDLSLESSERIESKRRRFNNGGRDLTTIPKGVERFEETIIPQGLQLLPFDASSYVVLGKVLRIQPFLSQDNSRIFSEVSLEIEEVIKRPKAELTTNSKELTLTELGGTLRLASGAIVRDVFRIVGRENICNNTRYVFFLTGAVSSDDLRYLKVFELSDQKVFAFEKGKRIPLADRTDGVPNDEASFLNRVRASSSQP
jgi:hypothetical protein